MKYPAAIVFILLSLLIHQTGIAEPAFHAPARSVLGQPDYVSDSVITPASAQTLNFPEGVAIDPVSGKVFVADSKNNRILRYSTTEAYQINGTAEAVFGQADFSSVMANRGGAVAANTLSYPLNLAFDSAGRLWVTDSENKRVLRFDDAANKPTGTAVADAVIGQADMASNVDPGIPSGGNGHSGFVGPCGITVDASGNLYVADVDLHRVLRFDDAANKMFTPVADAVFGQPDLESSNQLVGADALQAPYGLSIGPNGELWVADSGNNRVLRYDNAASFVSGGDANGVLGQDDLDSDSSTDPPTVSSIASAYYVTAQSNGTLWVSDYSHVRVLGFRNAAQKANGAAADTLLGQPTFTSSPHLDPSQRNLVGPAQIAIGREGSLFVAVWDDSRVMRFSDPVSVRPKKKKIKTSKKRVTFRGTATGAERVQYKISGQGGYRNAKGGASSWKGKSKRLKKKRSRVKLRATSFDGVTAYSKMKILRKSR